jgi:hypothetical protein
VLPAEVPATGNGANGTHAVVRRPAAEEFLQAITAAVAGAIQTSGTCPVRLADRLYLTVPEAAELTGLGVGFRRQIADGKLELVKGAGPRRADVLRRSELEKL